MPSRGRTVLVTGGAGYIGSHAVLALADAKDPVVVLDNLSTGQRRKVPSDVPFVEGEIADIDLVRRLLSEHDVRSVMHFAGSIIVPESVTDPAKYYENNSFASLKLIETCCAAGVGEFIFSSTAAVYGEPEWIPVDEGAPTNPVNPYGSSKLMTETMLRDMAATCDLNYAILRYFNVAGADPDGRSGQTTAEPTHLLERACLAALGRLQGLKVFGEDYDTPDGTCIRDYIHVTDLIDAHILALSYLRGNGPSTTLNCGYGHGYSVSEVLRAVEGAAETRLDAEIAPRRAGDAAALVAGTNLIRETLGWSPRYDDLNFIVKTALEWTKSASRS